MNLTIIIYGSNMGLRYNSDYFFDVEALNTIVRITAGSLGLSTVYLVKLPA
jgi:hypothetical protein